MTDAGNPRVEGLAAHVFDAPETRQEKGRSRGPRLSWGLTPEVLETYFHQFLMSMGGWVQGGALPAVAGRTGGGSDDIMAQMPATGRPGK